MPRKPLLVQRDKTPILSPHFCPDQQDRRAGILTSILTIMACGIS